MMLVVNISYSENENHSWIEWYKRRILRIFPGYWIMNIIILLFYFMAYNSYFELTHILVNLGGFQMIPIDNQNFSTIHFIYWFITALLLCYLLFPLFFYVIRRNFRAALIVSIILFVILAIFLTSFLIESVRDYIIIFYILKFFVFFFGMSFGYWIGINKMENLEKIFQSRLILYLALIFIGVLSLFSFFFFTEGYFVFMFPIIASIAIPLLIFLLNKSTKINKGLLFFGERSYEIYLVQSISFLFLEFLFFSLLLMPKDLTTELIMLPIFLILVFVFAYFLNIIIKKINNLEKCRPYILLFVMSFFLYTLVALFIFFMINFFLALLIYTSAWLFLVLVYLYKRKTGILETERL